jgi:hypothetical protein
MNRNTLILLAVSVVALVLVLLTFRGGDTDTYIAAIEKDRADRNRYFSTAEDSPFKGDTFSGLNYFPPDPAYRVQADLDIIEDKRLITLSTNDGKSQPYQEYAWAEFSLGQLRFRLLILESIESGPLRSTLLLAFADGTSARETYGAGRYLDVKKVAGAATLELDFNKAYNPYCAYADHYSCPLPPLENILDIAIRAGEKSYH